jgi:hypothetical protein
MLTIEIHIDNADDKTTSTGSSNHRESKQLRPQPTKAAGKLSLLVDRLKVWWIERN